jgi:hypothetical protein
MDREEISNLYRGPSIDASHQVSDQLALQFQRRRLKCEKLILSQSVSKHGYHQNLVGIIYGTSSMKIAHIVAMPLAR